MTRVRATLAVETSVEVELDMPADQFTDGDILEAATAQTFGIIPMDAELTDVLWVERIPDGS
jgi:hypothetical protein